MKTLKKLPFVLAIVVSIFAASCGEDTTIEPVRTEDEKPGIPIPPPPSGNSIVSSDSTTVG